MILASGGVERREFRGNIRETHPPASTISNSGMHKDREQLAPNGQGYIQLVSLK